MGRISYEGRLVNTERMPIKFGKSKNAGLVIAEVTIAEQHSGKNSKVAQKYQDRTKGTEDYVPTTTTWHRVTIMGEKAEALLQDENFNHGAIFEVIDATYVEEDPWKTRDEVLRAGRPETIGDRQGTINVKVSERQGIILGPNDDNRVALWDGVSPLPEFSRGGSGGGAPDWQPDEDEGF
jgi:hypothetical protein